MTTAVPNPIQVGRNASGKSHQLNLQMVSRFTDDATVGIEDPTKCCNLILDLPLRDRRIVLDALGRRAPGELRRWMIEQAARRLKPSATDAGLLDLKWGAKGGRELVILAATAPRIRGQAYDQACGLAKLTVRQLDTCMRNDGEWRVTARVFWELIRDGMVGIARCDDGLLTADVGLFEMRLAQTAVTGTVLTTDWSCTMPSGIAGELIGFAGALLEARAHETEERWTV